jgi:ornithine--oxo-acid transaminase
MFRRSTTFLGDKLVTPTGVKSAAFMRADAQFAAHNYAPMPVVIAKGKGVHVWDPEGKKYYDFLAGYGAVNFGHGHPRIIEAAKNQLDKLTLCSRAFYNDQLGSFAHDLCKTTATRRPFS